MTRSHCGIGEKGAGMVCGGQRNEELSGSWELPEGNQKTLSDTLGAARCRPLEQRRDEGLIETTALHTTHDLISLPGWPT